MGYLARLLFVLFIVLSGDTASAQGTLPITSFPSIAQMQAIGAASPLYPTVTVTGTQGGTFLWVSGSLPCNAITGGGDGGTTFCAGAPGAYITTGYRKRQLPGSYLTTLMFGSDPTGSVDSAAAFNKAYLAATNLSLPITDPSGLFKILSTVTLQPGVSYSGSAIGQYGPSSAGTILNFTGMTNTATPCFFMQLPNGTDTVIGASFYNASIRCPGTYAIQQNTIGGGFTDDGTTQDYLFNVDIRNLYVSGGTIAAVQLSKCFEATVQVWIDNRYFTPGDLLDFEGCDFPTVLPGSRLTQTNGSAIKFIAHGTFGNNNWAQGPIDILAFDNSHPAVVLDGRLDGIDKVGIEGNTTGPLVRIGSGGTYAGYNHTVSNNYINGNSSTHWLTFASSTACPLSTVVLNNQSTATNGVALFPVRCPIWYNANVLTTISYAGNTDTTAAVLPLLSDPSDSNRNGYQWYISPSNGRSLSFSDGCGGTATATSGAFDFSQCSGGAFLNFYSNSSSGGSVIGTVATDIVAFCSGGTGTLDIRGDDGSHSTTVQTATLSLGPSPTLVKDAFAGAGVYSTYMIFMTRPGTCADPRILWVGTNSN